MNEYEPQQPTPPERHELPIRYSPTLEALGIRDDDPNVVALWEEGITRWGYAFIAFTRLGAPELHTPDALVAFHQNYLVSFPNINEAIQNQIEIQGWREPFRTFLAEHRIPVDVLHWDYESIEAHMMSRFRIVREGGKVHFFAP